MPAYRYHPHVPPSPVAQLEDQSAIEQHGVFDSSWMANGPLTSQYDDSVSSSCNPDRAGYSTMPSYVPHSRRSSYENPNQKRRSYHGEGYFDSAREPQYHYQDPWAVQQPEGLHIDSSGWAPLSTSSTPARALFHAIPYQHAASPWETDAPLYPNSRSLGYINGNSQIAPYSAFSVPPTNRMRSYSYYAPNPSISATVNTHAIGLPGPAAHQPIAPAQQSTYSELSVHLQAMDKLKRDEEALKSAPAAPTLRTPEASEIPKVPAAPTPDPAKAPQIPTPAPANNNSNGQGPTVPRLLAPAKVKLIAPQPQPASKPPPASATSSIRPLKALSRSSTTEQKKTVIPCDFCKERKIACGRPPEGSADPTCNQCRLRSFKCVYPKERIPRRSRSRK